MNTRLSLSLRLLVPFCGLCGLLLVCSIRIMDCQIIALFCVRSCGERVGLGVLVRIT